MARKRHSDEEVLKLLCEIELKLSSGMTLHLPVAAPA